jgi:hypothetical protein
MLNGTGPHVHAPPTIGPPSWKHSWRRAALGENVHRQRCCLPDLMDPQGAARPTTALRATFRQAETHRKREFMMTKAIPLAHIGTEILCRKKLRRTRRGTDSRAIRR